MIDSYSDIAKLEANFVHLFCFQTLAVAISSEDFNNVVCLAMKDIVDGVVSGNVLYLTTAEIILAGESTNDVLIKSRHHRLPNAHAGFERRLLKLESAIITLCSLVSSIFPDTYLIHLSALR